MHFDKLNITTQTRICKCHIEFVEVLIIGNYYNTSINSV